MRAAFVLAAAASGPSDLWQSAVPVGVPGSHEECRWVEILHYVPTGGAPYQQIFGFMDAAFSPPPTPAKKVV